METNLLALLNNHHQKTLGEPKSYEYLTDGDPDELDEDIQRIVEAACDEIMTIEGVNIKAIRELSSAGYQVSRGESDSYGWITGVIRTRVGLIVFG